MANQPPHPPQGIRRPGVGPPAAGGGRPERSTSPPLRSTSDPAYGPYCPRTGTRDTMGR